MKCKYWSITQNACVHRNTMKATLNEPTFENAKAGTIIKKMSRIKRKCLCEDYEP
ncbi:hypothetical protein LCGC14_1866810 [marine sediment metagenome]|uniref:Uncharacterized protein n=1 Tax=marine sediment metagenome TaxID=412755 RepID=A0A0F9G620_9ZZZZ